MDPSILAKASFYPPDEVFNLTQQYTADKHPHKILVGRGAYQDGEGKPWILPSVRLAAKLVHGSDHEYLPIAGLQSFRDRAVKLILHGTRAFEEGKIASCQAVAGTGALFMAGAALKRMDPSSRDLLITSPTWPNHKSLFESLGFMVKEIPYYRDQMLDFHSYLAALKSARPGSVMILHACAHNPTGCDPSKEQWREIGEVVQERKLFPIFDAAYLGFNSGDVNQDSWAIRFFVEDLALEVGVCVSFAKSMGLYGERIGLVAFVTRTETVARNVDSVLERVQRLTISTPPAYGAKIVSTILGTPALKSQWERDMTVMSNRILSMRKKLHERLLELDTPGDWSHILSQTGMFSYLGLTRSQATHLKETYHIYMLESSRIALTGLNDGNLEYFTAAVDRTVREIQ